VSNSKALTEANYTQKNTQTQERRRYPYSEFFFKLNEKLKHLTTSEVWEPIRIPEGCPPKHELVVLSPSCKVKAVSLTASGKTYRSN
jgi:hypothetical protein